jgi:hypothetical protein
VVQEPSGRRPERVGSAAEASARVGFPVVLPKPGTLPSGLNATPTFEVSTATELRFTYQHAKAREYVRRVGRPDFPLSERFDGATLVIHVPAGVLQNYRGGDQNRNLVIGQAGEVTAGVEGNVGLDELRDYLLGFPGMPDEAVRVLRGVPDWRSVMPVPVPLDRVSGQSVTVGGVSGLMIADNTGLGSGVIFNRDGRLYGVAGNYRSNEILAVANGL